MTEDQKEIEALKGELSAATLCIAELYSTIAGLGGDGMLEIILRKISNRKFKPGLLDIKGPDWLAGSQRFNERLTNHLSRDD